ncbi:winged helix-turn-helix domain-containing protein [Thalassotalea euphylliae]|uniref:winged helix-turn-helix domain-containing protein n=1 Tax=Thalassotalea euphylliae TaxID=1655234 RepID=UPI00363D3F7E
MSNFRFEEFLLDSNAQSLTHNGQKILLEPKLLKLLVFFCENPHRAISRDELLEHVWDGRIVGSAAINRAVGELRKAIEEDVKTPNLLETVSKVGYRFTPQVDVISEENQTQPAITDTERKNALRWWLQALLILVCLILIIVLTVNDRRDPKNNEVTWLDRPLTTDKGVAFKPDGHRTSADIVYLYRPSSDVKLPQVWLKPENQQAYALTSDNFYYTAVMLSDDRRIFASRFNNLKERKCEIVEINPSTKSLNVITGCASRALTQLDYSSDTQKIYFNTRAAVNQPFHIASLQLNTNRLEQITFSDGQGNKRGDYLFKLSPHQDRLAVVQYVDTNHGQVRLIDLANKESKELKVKLANLSAIDWFDKDTLVLSADGSIYQFHIPSQAIELLSQQDGAGQIAFSNDGVAYVLAKVSHNIYELPIDNSGSREVKKMPLTNSRYSSYLPGYANNSKWLVFSSDKTGSWRIYLQDAGGNRSDIGAPEEIHNINNLRWSQSDEIISASINGKAYVYKLASEQWHQVAHHIQNIHFLEPLSESQFVVSSDQSGDWQLWLVDEELGTHKQLTRSGGYSVRANGSSSLYFTKFAETGLYQLDLLSLKERLVVADFAITDWNRWFLTAKHLYYISDSGLVKLGLSGRTDAKSITLLGNAGNHLSISHNEKHVAVTFQDEAWAEIRYLSKGRE